MLKHTSIFTAFIFILSQLSPAVPVAFAQDLSMEPGVSSPTQSSGINDTEYEEEEEIEEEEGIGNSLGALMDSDSPLTAADPQEDAETDEVEEEEELELQFGSDGLIVVTPNENSGAHTISVTAKDESGNVVELRRFENATILSSNPGELSFETDNYFKETHTFKLDLGLYLSNIQGSFGPDYNYSGSYMYDLNRNDQGRPELSLRQYETTSNYYGNTYSSTGVFSGNNLLSYYKTATGYMIKFYMKENGRYNMFGTFETSEEPSVTQRDSNGRIIKILGTLQDGTRFSANCYIGLIRVYIGGTEYTRKEVRTFGDNGRVVIERKSNGLMNINFESEDPSSPGNYYTITKYTLIESFNENTDGSFSFSSSNDNFTFYPDTGEMVRSHTATLNSLPGSFTEQTYEVRKLMQNPDTGKLFLEYTSLHVIQTYLSGDFRSERISRKTEDGRKIEYYKYGDSDPLVELNLYDENNVRTKYSLTDLPHLTFTPLPDRHATYITGLAGKLTDGKVLIAKMGLETIDTTISISTMPLGDGTIEVSRNRNNDVVSVRYVVDNRDVRTWAVSGIAENPIMNETPSFNYYQMTFNLPEGGTIQFSYKDMKVGEDISHITIRKTVKSEFFGGIDLIEENMYVVYGQQILLNTRDLKHPETNQTVQKETYALTRNAETGKYYTSIITIARSGMNSQYPLFQFITYLGKEGNFTNHIAEFRSPPAPHQAWTEFPNGFNYTSEKGTGLVTAFASDLKNGTTLVADMTPDSINVRTDFKAMPFGDGTLTAVKNPRNNTVTVRFVVDNQDVRTWQVAGLSAPPPANPRQVEQSWGTEYYAGFDLISGGTIVFLYQDRNDQIKDTVSIRVSKPLASDIYPGQLLEERTSYQVYGKQIIRDSRSIRNQSGRVIQLENDRLRQDPETGLWYSDRLSVTRSPQNSNYPQFVYSTFYDKNGQETGYEAYVLAPPHLNRKDWNNLSHGFEIITEPRTGIVTKFIAGLGEGNLLEAEYTADRFSYSDFRPYSTELLDIFKETYDMDPTDPRTLKVTIQSTIKDQLINIVGQQVITVEYYNGVIKSAAAEGSRVLPPDTQATNFDIQMRYVRDNKDVVTETIIVSDNGDRLSLKGLVSPKDSLEKYLETLKEKDSIDPALKAVLEDFYGERFDENVDVSLTASGNGEALYALVLKEGMESPLVGYGVTVAQRSGGAYFVKAVTALDKSGTAIATFEVVENGSLSYSVQIGSEFKLIADNVLRSETSSVWEGPISRQIVDTGAELAHFYQSDFPPVAAMVLDDSDSPVMHVLLLFTGDYYTETRVNAHRFDFTENTDRIILSLYQIQERNTRFTDFTFDGTTISSDRFTVEYSDGELNRPVVMAFELPSKASYIAAEDPDGIRLLPDGSFIVLLDLVDESFRDYLIDYSEVVFDKEGSFVEYRDIDMSGNIMRKSHILEDGETAVILYPEGYGNFVEVARFPVFSTDNLALSVEIIDLGRSAFGGSFPEGVEVTSFAEFGIPRFDVSYETGNYKLTETFVYDVVYSNDQYNGDLDGPHRTYGALHVKNPASGQSVRFDIVERVEFTDEFAERTAFAANILLAGGPTSSISDMSIGEPDPDTGIREIKIDFSHRDYQGDYTFQIKDTAEGYEVLSISKNVYDYEVETSGDFEWKIDFSEGQAMVYLPDDSGQLFLAYSGAAPDPVTIVTIKELIDQLTNAPINLAV